MVISVVNTTYTPKRRISTNVGYLIAIVLAVIVLALLQYQYWHGEYGRADYEALQVRKKELIRIRDEQLYANSILVADVQDLKSGLSAIEEHARLDLGLIKPGETFMQLSTAPITYSRQIAPPMDSTVESVDSVPEVEKPTTSP